jgi:hypothetical protein
MCFFRFLLESRNGSYKNQVMSRWTRGSLRDGSRTEIRVCVSISVSVWVRIRFGVRVRFSIVASGWLLILLRFNDLKNWRPSWKLASSPSHWNEYNWNATSDWKFEAKLEDQSQSFHVCEERSISQSWYKYT